MKLSYLALPNGKKLIPYHRQDYKSEEIDGVYYFIDGEASSYIRTSHPNLVKSTSLSLYGCASEINFFLQSEKNSHGQCCMIRS